MSVNIARHLVPIKANDEPVVAPISLIEARKKLIDRHIGDEEATTLLLIALEKQQITAHFEIENRTYEVTGRYWICDPEFKQEQRWRPDLALETSRLNFGPANDPIVALPLYAPYNDRPLFLERTKFKAWLDEAKPRLAVRSTQQLSERINQCVDWLKKQPKDKRDNLKLAAKCSITGLREREFQTAYSIVYQRGPGAPRQRDT